jgi:hypothetical protein
MKGRRHLGQSNVILAVTAINVEIKVFLVV